MGRTVLAVNAMGDDFEVLGLLSGVAIGSVVMLLVL
jgi:hypothetical protein